MSRPLTTWRRDARDLINVDLDTLPAWVLSLLIAIAAILPYWGLHRDVA